MTYNLQLDFWIRSQSCLEPHTHTDAGFPSPAAPNALLRRGRGKGKAWERHLRAFALWVEQGFMTTYLIKLRLCDSVYCFLISRCFLRMQMSMFFPLEGCVEAPLQRPARTPHAGRHRSAQQRGLEAP